MSIIDVGFSNADGSGPVYLVSDEDYAAITQTGYVPIETLTNAGIDYTAYKIFIVQWLGDDARSHVALFNPFFDETSGNITLASYF